MQSQENIKKVLCIGDCCADILIPYGQAKTDNKAQIEINGGGTIGNLACGLARLKVDCAFLGSCGDDYLGNRLKKELQDEGVDVSRFNLRKDISTPTVLVVIDENKERFPFLMPKAKADQLYVYPEDLNKQLLSEFSYIFTSGFMFFDEGSKKQLCEFLKLAHQANVKVCLDCNLRVEQNNLDKSYLLQAISYSDYLFVSVEDDLLPLTNILDEDKAAMSLVSDSRIVIAKNGKKGSTIYTKDKIYHQDIYKVDVIDTLGAGDAYNAGFMYALVNDYDLKQANKIASIVGAINSTKKGARNCPNIEELNKLINNTK